MTVEYQETVVGRLPVGPAADAALAAAAETRAAAAERRAADTPARCGVTRRLLPALAGLAAAAVALVLWRRSTA
jgi:hypothetical protein